MTNIGMERTPPKDPRKQSDSSADFTRRRASDVNGPWTTHEQNDCPAEASIPGEPVVLRLESIPATARNLERVRERVRSLNSLLAASDVPFRLRVV
jgi:hypothetical protein